MIKEFFLVFIHYLVDVFPYFLFASLLGAVIQVFVSGNVIKRHLFSKPYTPVFTALLGASVPVCSCSMIPVARTFDAMSPRSYAPVIAFLITAPVLSPVVVVLTFGMFGTEITLFRVVLSLMFAVIVAYATLFLFKKKAHLPLFQGSGQAQRSRWADMWSNFRSLFISTGKYVLLGLFIASLFKVLVPESLVAAFASSPLSYPLIRLFSIPVYVCSGEEVPIARSLSDLGFTPGQALTFMLASSGICVPTITALASFLPRSLIIFYSLAWFIFSTSAGFLTDAILNAG